MNRIFFSLFLTLILGTGVAHAQVNGQAPITDTSKGQKAAQKKPVFSLQPLRVTPMYIFEINDNAKIDASHQFPGARILPDSLQYAGERHLKNVRQLTFEGVNTRPQVSPDDRYIVFQAHGIKENSCDQIYRMPLASGLPAGRISSGRGEASGAAFLSDSEIVYSSTESLYNGTCPPSNIWMSGSDLYFSDTNGKQFRRLTYDSSHFNGDASVSPNGERILFTSNRASRREDPPSTSFRGLELFSMARDGSDVTQLTDNQGFYDFASYSPDGKKIAYSAHAHLRSDLELFVMNADGSNKRRIFQVNSGNDAICWLPDGEHILFTKAHIDPAEINPNIYMIKADGSGMLEKITDGGGFNGFPVFTHDGKQLIFCSSRNATHPGDMNIFVADWVP